MALTEIASNPLVGILITLFTFILSFIGYEQLKKFYNRPILKILLIDPSEKPYIKIEIQKSIWRLKSERLANINLKKSELWLFIVNEGRSTLRNLVLSAIFPKNWQIEIKAEEFKLLTFEKSDQKFHQMHLGYSNIETESEKPLNYFRLVGTIFPNHREPILINIINYDTISNKIEEKRRKIEFSLYGENFSLKKYYLDLTCDNNGIS